MAAHENHASATRNLQRYLRQLSFSEPTIPTPPVDGIFEARTEEALREYQRLRGLPVTGEADRATWERLYAEYRASLAYRSPPAAPDLFPTEPQSFLLRAGAESFLVSALQYMLQELGHLYGELEELTVTGIYDQPTQAAVLAFQARNGILPTGSVDLLTWNTVTNQHNTYFRRRTV